MPDNAYIPDDPSILSMILQTGIGYASNLMGVPGQARLMPNYFTDAPGYDPYQMQQNEMRSRMRDSYEQRIRSMLSSSSADTVNQALSVFGTGSRTAERLVHDIARFPAGSQVLEGMLSKVGANPMDIYNRIQNMSETLYASRGGRVNQRDPGFALHQMTMQAGGLAESTMRQIYNDPMTGQMNFLRPNMHQTRGLNPNDFMAVMQQGITGGGTGFAGPGTTDQGIIRSTQNMAGMIKSFAQLMGSQDIQTAMKQLQDVANKGAFRLDENQIGKITQQIAAVSNTAQALGMSSGAAAPLIANMGALVQGTSQVSQWAPGVGAGIAQKTLFASQQALGLMATNPGMTMEQAAGEVGEYMSRTQGSTLDRMSRTVGAIYGMGEISQERYNQFLKVRQTGSRQEVMRAAREIAGEAGYSSYELNQLYKDTRRVDDIIHTKQGIGGSTIAMDVMATGMESYRRQKGKDFTDRSYRLSQQNIREMQQKYGVSIDTEGKQAEQVYLDRVMSANQQDYFGQKLDDKEIRQAFEKSGRAGVENLLSAYGVEGVTISKVRQQAETDFKGKRIAEVVGNPNLLKYRTIQSNSALQESVRGANWDEYTKAAAVIEAGDNSPEAQQRLEKAASKVQVPEELKGAYAAAEKRTRVDTEGQIRREDVRRSIRNEAGGDPIKLYAQYQAELQDIQRGAAKRDPKREAELRYRMESVRGEYKGTSFEFKKGVFEQNEQYNKDIALEQSIRDMDDKEFWQLRGSQTGLTEEQEGRLGEISIERKKFSKDLESGKTVDSTRLAELIDEERTIRDTGNKILEFKKTGRFNTISGMRNRDKSRTTVDKYGISGPTKESLGKERQTLQRRLEKITENTFYGNLTGEAKERADAQIKGMTGRLGTIDDEIFAAPTEENQQRMGQLLDEGEKSISGYVAKGAAMGSIAPGVGTIIGGVVGGVMGSRRSSAYRRAKTMAEKKAEPLTKDQKDDAAARRAMSPDSSAGGAASVSSNSAVINVSGSVIFNSSGSNTSSAKSSVGAK